MGSVGRASLTVEASDTAIALGSGDLAVLGTPRMIALMEQAACESLRGHLPAECTSVGAEIDIRHVRPSKIGAQIDAVAEVTDVDGVMVMFSLMARDMSIADEDRSVIGTGQHRRVIVERDTFMRRLR